MIAGLMVFVIVLIFVSGLLCGPPAKNPDQTEEPLPQEEFPRAIVVSRKNLS